MRGLTRCSEKLSGLMPMGCLGQTGKQIASIGQHSISFVALHKARPLEWYLLADLEVIPICIGYRMSSGLWAADNPLLTFGLEPPVWVYAMALARLCLTTGLPPGYRVPE